MSQTAIDAELESEFAAVAADAGCELVHAEFAGNTLRVYLDRPGGVTVDDCAKVSRQLSALLDVHEFGRRHYLLEVSSPGLDRKLYRPQDYEKFRGHMARVTCHQPSETSSTADRAGTPDRGSPGRGKKTLVGRLEGLRRDAATGDTQVSLLEPATGTRHRIPLADVMAARLEVEL